MGLGPTWAIPCTFPFQKAAYWWRASALRPSGSVKFKLRSIHYRASPSNSPNLRSPRRPLDSPAAVPSSSSHDSVGPFQARLEAELGGRAGVDQFAGQVLNWNETLMSHAYALRSLAQQFSSDASLNETDRDSLRSLANDHLVAMAVPARNFDHAMVPVLTGLGATARPQSAASDSTWQASAERVFQAARNVEMLSSKLLGVARGEKANADSPSELLGAVSDLRAHTSKTCGCLADKSALIPFYCLRTSPSPALRNSLREGSG